MTPTRSGSIRLVRIAGINLFLHWSWFAVAAFEISSRDSRYTSLLWNVLEYLALFLLVTLHEFGHALACRQVGGQADQIVLWPLGGVAYVNPPQRPGATLWSIAAGPLVNVVLMPVLVVLWLVSRQLGWYATLPNVYALIKAVTFINTALLCFNLLPIYPLDGGQILRSVLWFWLGRARSLMVATIIGFIGVAGLILLAITRRSYWFGILSVFILLNCWRGMKQALVLARVAKIPRHTGFNCPACQTAPPVGLFWACSQCRTPFDTFVTNAVCPKCGTQFPTTRCLDCGATHPLAEWRTAPPITLPPPPRST